MPNAAQMDGQNKEKKKKKRSSTGLVGSAGEHYVLYKLHRHGLLSAPAPRGYKTSC